MNDDKSRSKLSNTHQDELKSNLSSHQDSLNLPEPGLVAIDKGIPAEHGVEKNIPFLKWATKT